MLRTRENSDVFNSLDETQEFDDWTHFFFLLHFHPFGDPYDMFIQLFLPLKPFRLIEKVLKVK